MVFETSRSNVSFAQPIFCISWVILQGSDAVASFTRVYISHLSQHNTTPKKRADVG